MKTSQEFDDGSFIIANLDFSGFYRVNYDTENWELIIKQLDTNPQVLLDNYFFYFKSFLFNFLSNFHSALKRN